jgi:hypothetical protein
MEPMTPEERLTKIENAIQSLMEVQARHDTQIEKQNAQIDKNTSAIRDLILVSRTFLDSQKEVTVQIQELRAVQHTFMDQQKITEEKLHALIETVDRIIRDKKN